MGIMDWRFLLYAIIFWRCRVATASSSVSCVINFVNSNGTPLKIMKLKPKLIDKGIAYVQAIKDLTDELKKNRDVTEVTLRCSGLVKFSDSSVCIKKGDNLKTCWEKYAANFIPFTPKDMPPEDFRVFGRVLKDPVTESISPKEFKKYKSARFIGPLKHIGHDKKYFGMATYQGQRFNGLGRYFELKDGENLDMKNANFRIFSHVNIGNVRWFPYPAKNYKGNATPIGLPIGKKMLVRAEAHIEAKSFRTKYM